MANGMFDEIGEMDLFNKGAPGRSIGVDVSGFDVSQIPSDLIRDEIEESKLFRDFITIFGPELEGKGEAVSEWFKILQQYIEGEVTQEDIKKINVGVLSELPGWNEYFKSIVGEEEAVDESEQVTEQDAKKILSNIFGSEDAVPQSAFTGIMGPTGPLMGKLGQGCAYKGTPKEWEWWRQCVSLHVLVPILGLPELPSAVLGGILQSTTIGEIEDALRNINKKISDVFSDPEYTWENAVGDLGEWVKEKVEAAGDIFDPDGITIEDVLGTLGGAASSIIIQGVVNEVKDGLGIPVFVTTDEKCQAAGTKEDPDNPGQCLPTGVVDYGMCDDNLTTKLDQDGTNCPPGQSIPQVGDDCFTANDEAGKITNVGGELKCVPNAVVAPTKQCQDPDVAPDATGNCPEDYCADGTTLRSTQPFGMCPEDTTKQVGEYTAPTVDCNNPKIGFNNTTFDATASAKYAQYSSDYDAACFGGGGGASPNLPKNTKCDGNDLTLLDDSGNEIDRVPNHSFCIGGSGSGGDDDKTPTSTKCDGNDLTLLNAAGNEVDRVPNHSSCISGGGGGNLDDNIPTSTKCDGNDLTLLNAAGNEVDRVPNHSSCISGSIDDTPTGGGTSFNCISQNRKTNEDGSCGECLPGYSPDPNNFDECVKDDTIITGEPPGPTTETPPPSTSSGGGGGGGGGGMFTGSVSGISYTPQPLPGIQSGAPVNAMASLEGLIGRMLTGNIS